MYVLEAELPHRMVGLSDKLLSLNSTADRLFTMSLLRMDRNNVLVGYGVDDREAHLELISIDTLLDGVRPVDSMVY